MVGKKTSPYGRFMALGLHNWQPILGAKPQETSDMNRRCVFRTCVTFSWCFADETPTGWENWENQNVFACKKPILAGKFLVFIHDKTPAFWWNLKCFLAAGLLEVLESGKFLLSAFGVKCSEGCPARALAIDVDLHLESLRRWHQMGMMGLEKMGAENHRGDWTFWESHRRCSH